MELKRISFESSSKSGSGSNRCSRSSISICLLASLLTLVLLSLSVSQVSSRPSIDGQWPPSHHQRMGISSRATQECNNASREIRELCQRCAKVTKSKLAYQMCCEEQEDARTWCSELLMIG